MPERKTVIVVDDHPLYRRGVVKTLAGEGRFDVVAEGASAAEAVRLAGELKPDVMLLDISMPGNGVEAARQIAAAQPGINIAMLTVSEADDDIMSALQAGAKGYILKGVGADELIGILAGIARGESYVSPGLAARLLVSLKTRPAAAPPADSPLAALTAREEQILKLVAQGLSNKEVGRKLDLQEKTVKHYMTNILQKLNARNRVEAAVLAKESWKKQS
ncbi:response regulator transcription factor [Mesorhizobium sp. CN2-181]|uniref:response regulator transcription factor n=1 Tax=Mesorhizobium yinganensis TaxID=3157707 RepID=UPI0032B77794